jgi:hypothetical protein
VWVASVLRKRLRKVRSQSALVVKGRPFVTELIGTAYDTFGQFAEVRRFASPVGSRGLVHARDLQRLQLIEQRGHSAVRFAEEDTASHACKCPSEAFEHRLALNVVAELFEWEVTISIALDSQTLSVSFHNQINAHGADFPPRNYVVTRLNQSLHDIAFEG